MLAHNKAMKVILQTAGIECTPKRLDTGSMRGTWRLYNKKLTWSDSLTNALSRLDFKDFDGKELSWLSGNGGSFQVFVRAPQHILDQINEAN